MKDHYGRYDKFFFEQDMAQTDISSAQDVNRLIAADPNGRVGISAPGYVAVLMFLMGKSPRWFDWYFGEPHADFSEFAEQRPLGGAFV